MAINFPDSPNDGDIFTSNGKKWIYGGGKWSSYGLAIAPDVLKVDSVNNRVGVNNLSPSVDLDVTGNAAVSGSLTVDGDLTISGNTTTLNTTELYVEDNKVTLNSGATGSATANAGIEVERGDDPNVEILWDESADAWKIATDFTVDAGTLHVDSANNRVGIGTTTPTVALQVDSGSTDQFAAPQIYVAPSGHASSDRAAIQLDDIQLLTDIAGDGTEDFSIYSNNAAAHRFSIDGSGNVGINDFTPSYTLDVNGDINATGAVLMGGDALNLTTALTGTYQSLSSGSSHAINYSGPGSVVVSNSAGWWSASNPTRITVDRSGVFLITATAQIGYNGSTNFFSFSIHKNGSVIADIVVDSAYYPGQSISLVDSASSGTYYTFNIYQQTGSTLNLWAGRNFFGVTLLRT